MAIIDELINAIVLCVASMVVGAIFHSAGGHAGYNQRVRAWIEKYILRKKHDPFDCSRPKGARYPDCLNGPSPVCKHCSHDTDCGEIPTREDHELD